MKVYKELTLHEGMGLERYLGMLDAVGWEVDNLKAATNLGILGDAVRGLYKAAEELDFVSVLRFALGIGERCEVLESCLPSDDWNVICTKGVDDVFEQVASELSKKG